MSRCSGLYGHGDGYWVIKCRDGSVLLFHRAVMAATIGRLLRSDEIVHHINGVRGDDRVENLAITTRAEHMNIHRRDLLAGWVRSHCPHGHEYTPENTHFRPQGWRVCLACRQLRNERRRAVA